MERLTTDARKIFARESIILNSMTKGELRQHYREIFDRLQKYEVAEENGTLVRLPCKVQDLIDTIFSHNEIIALWVNATPDSKKLIWRGEAWRLPEEHKNKTVDRIFGVIPEFTPQSDTINILLAACSKLA